MVLFTCLPGYTCALQKDILYQGRMFVSDHWICFHSKVFGKDTKVAATPLESQPFVVRCFPPDAFIVCQIAIPVMSVTHIKKTKTAILVPNALVIATANDKVRRSPSSRKTRNTESGILRQGYVEYLTGWFFCAVCLCVLPVPRQHLQDPDVHLSSSGGRTDVPQAILCFFSHRL